MIGVDVLRVLPSGCFPCWYAITQDTGATPLLLATWKGHLEVVTTLLSSGANTNQSSLVSCTCGTQL